MNPSSVSKKNSFLTRIPGIRFLYRHLIEPRSDHDDIRRKEFILNILLVGTLVLCLLLGISILLSHIIPEDSYSGISPVLFSGISLFFSSLLYLSRKKYVSVASYGFVGLYFLATVYGTYQWSFTPPMIILVTMVTIVISSILISSRFGFILTVIMSCIVAIITYLQIHQYIPLDLYWRNDPLLVKDALQMALLLFLVSGISWLSNRETEKSLDRALASEQDLVIERNLLELKVEERTRDLKLSQEKALHQIGYLAEFGKISSGVFHDLMNPLNTVIAHIDRLSETDTAAHETKDYLRKAVIASKRMGHYLETIKKSIKPSDLIQSFSPEKEIHDALDLLGHKARLAQATIVVTAAPSITLIGNALRFHQVALNLISNAIDAVQDLEIENKNIYLELHQKEHVVVFSVTDFGKGIIPSNLTTVFNPSFTTKNNAGIGLGLATVKSIIETEFHGSISVTSTPDQGTLFCVTIPISN